jgi:hypothetical protein
VDSPPSWRWWGKVPAMRIKVAIFIVGLAAALALAAWALAQPMLIPHAPSKMAAGEIVLMG